MKLLFEKALIVLMLAFMTPGITSCGDDDKGEPNDGAMTGWVEINGKKYDFTYYYGSRNVAATKFFFEGYSKDPYKVGKNDHFNYAAFSMTFAPDGSIQIGGDGKRALAFEFQLDRSRTGFADQILYTSIETSFPNVTVSKNIDRLTIDGRNVEVRYTGKGAEVIKPDDPVTTVNFHFEGAVKWAITN